MTTFLSAGIILATGWVELVFTAVAVIIAIVLHEVAHGYVALLNGDATAKVNGRLSLNPIRHFDPVGFIMLLVCGFGYAKPVPVNPYNFRHRKRGIFTVAAAGVTANFLLAFISSGFMVLMRILFARSGAAVFSGLYTFFCLFMLINLSLVFFNLLPICPLGRIPHRGGFHPLQQSGHPILTRLRGVYPHRAGRVGRTGRHLQYAVLF